MILKNIKLLKDYFIKIQSQYDFYNFLFLLFVYILGITCIDYFNILINIYYKVGMLIFWLSIILILIKILSLKIYDLFTLKSVNYVDYYNLIILCGTIIYKMILFSFNSILGLNEFKIKILGIIIYFSLFLFIYRIEKLKYKQDNLNNKTNVYDFKDLYENTIPQEEEFIFVNDEEVDYDLLKRNHIITQMTNTILNCNPSSKYVISLKGPWGSGKTTIIKNIKRKINDSSILFIDDFEPWTYNDEESLLCAFFDIIMKRINCGFRINEINLFTKTYLTTIASNTKYKFNEFIKYPINVTRIKNIINNYIDLNNIKVVLVIDDLERCTSAQILFIIKLIHNLFDFHKFIYILSYDEKAMKKHFEENLNIDYSYLEKIIQLEFTVPQIDQNTQLDVVKQCVRNYILHTSISKEDLIENELVENVSNSINNLRDLKRLINSAFNSSFQNNKYLNSMDMLFIEFLSLKDTELYYEINKNKKYFISEDVYVYNNTYFDKNKYNIETTKYFKNLFENTKHRSYRSILCFLFPNVKTYFDNESKGNIQFISENLNYKDRNLYKMSIRNKRIYNGKFFDLYFNRLENEFIIIDQEINKFIKYLNNDQFDNEIAKVKFLNMEKVYEGWIEMYTMETFQLYIDKIESSKLFSLAKVIFDIWYEIDDSGLFMQLNARSRAEVILAEIISKFNDTEFNIFEKQIEGDYKNIFLISRILYWLSPDRIIDFRISQEKYDRLNTKLKENINEICTKKINIYDFKYYNRRNMCLLLENENYCKYIKEKITIDNLILFLLDFMGMSIGKDKCYTFSKETIDKLYGWDNAKKDIVKCQDSELKDFFIKVFSNLKKFDSKYIYIVQEWLDLDDMVKKYIQEYKNTDYM